MFIALTPLLLVGCGSTGDSKASVEPKTGTTSQVITLEGYPLDRSLKGFTGMEDRLDYLGVVQVTGGASSVHWTTPDGRAPAFIDESRAPDPKDGLVNLVTSLDIQSISAAKETVTPRSMSVVGGSLDGIEYVADSEIAPALKDVTGVLLVGGAVSKDGVLDPWFVYSVDAQGKATSLIDSASASDVGIRPSFMVSDVDPGLKLP